MAKILVGVTGSISAYKAIDFVNGLSKTGNDVRVIMTDSAKKFINPINFFSAETFTDTEEWESPKGFGVLHIDLAKWADCIVLYPTTANTIAKIIQGRADNLLTCTWLASTAKKIVFPAMNTEMLRNKTTRSNLDAMGMMKDVEVMATESGILACGDKGPGKVIKPRKAVIVVNQKINYVPSKKTILVTSGGTKAYIDDVRVVTNISSGGLGATIVDEILQNTGYNIIHIAPKMSMRSTVAGVFSHRYRYYRADTVEEVYDAMEKYVPEADAVIHSMAISDFTFDSSESTKLKSSDPDGFISSMRDSIKQSPKIIKKIKEWNPNTIQVGFKFEVGVGVNGLKKLALKQIADSGSDFVLANDKEEMQKHNKHIAYLYNTYNKYPDNLNGKDDIAECIIRRIKESFNVT